MNHTGQWPEKIELLVLMIDCWSPLKIYSLHIVLQIRKMVEQWHQMEDTKATPEAMAEALKGQDYNKIANMILNECSHGNIASYQNPPNVVTGTQAEGNQLQQTREPVNPEV